jgi:hypothetical protein
MYVYSLAAEHPAFSSFCVSTGRRYNVIITTVNVKLLGHRAKEVRPASPAVDSELFNDICFVMLSVFVLL